ncbi:MAG: uracil-DNA glycosylase [Chloroflexota bacterium]|nr:uracil-DNA glycosylase [Chloroflexota bacterium]
MVDEEGMVDELERRRAQLEALEAQVRCCTRCPLSTTRIHAVPGEGPIDAAIMFIGEGPGGTEDRTGRPFVGAAGQFLEALLASIGLTREDVYIANVVKCRPPANRDPLPNEIDACKPYLAHQLGIIDPEVIVTLGRFAMERWLPDKRITRVRGQAFRHGRRLIVPMLHPAAALHRPQWRPLIEEDFLLLPGYIDKARRMRAGEDVAVEDAVQQEESAMQQRLL